jgi:glycosyltransferase involved in cell wall biosynthesis
VTVFFAFRNASDRRTALATEGALDRYRLFGLDELCARGIEVRHNLERDGAPLWARAVATVANGLLRLAGGYGGDFASVLGSLRTANRADVVFATADTIGIPVILLKRAGLLRPPVVYVSIGLPERLLQLRNAPMRRLYAGALRRAAAIVAYAESEARWVRRWLAPRAPRVVFVPFGVDVEAFAPHVNGAPVVDVVSVGADPRRDFGLLRTIAERHPELRFGVIAGTEHARALASTPSNVAVETDVPLERVREQLAGARVIALPVRRNSYSGATTVLLQAMALGKPVVVSRTEAIAEGYGLEDGVNCRLVEPGDEAAFERVLLETLADPQTLGARARETVERDFSWRRYTDTLSDILSAACTREPS